MANFLYDLFEWFPTPAHPHSGIYRQLTQFCAFYITNIELYFLIYISSIKPISAIFSIDVGGFLGKKTKSAIFSSDVGGFFGQNLYPRFSQVMLQDFLHKPYFCDFLHLRIYCTNPISAILSSDVGGYLGQNLYLRFSLLVLEDFLYLKGQGHEILFG